MRRIPCLRPTLMGNGKQKKSRSTYEYPPSRLDHASAMREAIKDDRPMWPHQRTRAERSERSVSDGTGAWLHAPATAAVLFCAAGKTETAAAVEFVCTSTRRHRAKQNAAVIVLGSFARGVTVRCHLRCLARCACVVQTRWRVRTCSHGETADGAYV